MLINKDAKVLFVSDFLRAREVTEKSVLAGERKDILINALNAAGIVASDYTMIAIHNSTPTGGKISGFNKDQKIEAQRLCRQLILESKANIIVPLGEYALKFITGLDGINKHHLSLYQSKADLGGKKCMPMLHPETIQKSYGDICYIRFGAMKLKQELWSTTLNIPERHIQISLDLTFDEQIAYLENIIKNAQEVSTDVETNEAGINTVGLAITSQEAIAIESTPNGKTAAEYKKLWELYAKIWSSENIGKIAQNGLFEATWASVYGIQFKNLIWDTMLAMKYLHPTLECNLGNVGRIYTKYPFWKDDHSDWNDIRNWRDHLTYCGKDAVGQYAAYVSQKVDLTARGRLDRFRELIMSQIPIAQEMQARGLRLDLDKISQMKLKAEDDIAAMTKSFDMQCQEATGKTVNLNSPKQVKDLLKGFGLKLPVLKGKETVSRAALLKLKNKYPKVHVVKDMLKIDDLRKKNEEYLNFDFDKDERVRCSFNLASDETGEWVGKKTIFNKGFDFTNIPSVVKNAIIADHGMTLIELKLDQPEVRFIAANCPEPKMTQMLFEYRDVNRYMASKIFRKPEEICNPNEIKIASLAIRSANYMDAPKQFVEKCFARSGVLYEDVEAKRIMNTVLEEFPGCRKRVDRIKKQMYSSRMLSSPDRQIVYYDRINDSLLRKALAWEPESNTNDRITKMAIALQPEVELLNRGKDFLLFQVPHQIVQNYLDLKSPEVKVSYGTRWGSMTYV